MGGDCNRERWAKKNSYWGTDLANQSKVLAARHLYGVFLQKNSSLDEYIYYLPIYCWLPLNLPFLTIFYASPRVEFIVKAGKVFFSKCIHTYHAVRTKNITVPAFYSIQKQHMFFSIFANTMNIFHLHHSFKWRCIFRLTNIFQQTYKNIQLWWWPISATYIQTN